MSSKKSVRVPLVVLIIGGIGLAVLTVLYRAGVVGADDSLVQRMAAPSPVHPPCGNVMRSPVEGKSLVFRWTPVRDTSFYDIEVDCFGCAEYPDQWYSVSGAPWLYEHGVARDTLQTPVYSSELHKRLKEAGGTRLRWRVWANGSDRVPGHKSEWCEHTFHDD